MFRDREDAGRRLAERLSGYQETDAIVLGLPRGGVPVGYEVARALRAPLDIIVARKLGAPGHPELGIGAVAHGGVRVLDSRIVDMLYISQEYIDAITAAELEELERRLRRYRGDRPAPKIEGRTVILVDDGLATGVSARAAARSVRAQRPRRLVLAVPVCAAETAQAIRPEVDELGCVLTPTDFRAVSLWYGSFPPVSDDEVVQLLERARREAETDTRGAQS